jgi:hypothetical protein
MTSPLAWPNSEFDDKLSANAMMYGKEREDACKHMDLQSDTDRPRSSVEAVDRITPTTHTQPDTASDDGRMEYHTILRSDGYAERDALIAGASFAIRTRLCQKQTGTTQHKSLNTTQHNVVHGCCQKHVLSNHAQRRCLSNECSQRRHRRAKDRGLCWPLKGQ